MLAITDCSAGYDGTRVVEKITLAAERNMITALLGKSGSGKSTLLSVIAGLKQPDEGTVLFDGTPVIPADPRIGIVFQHHGLLPWYSAYRNICLGLKLRDMPRHTRREKTGSIIHRFGLSGEQNKFPGELSGGQKQRVALARTLVLEPQLLLLDEPFSALDALTRESMQDFLLDTLRSRSAVTLFVTHSIEEAVYLSDRVLILTESGRLYLKTFAIAPASSERDRTFRDTASYSSAVRTIRKVIDSV